jgi:hypothetical protein
MPPPCRGFETVSYLLEGEFTHEDFAGNKVKRGLEIILLKISLFSNSQGDKINVVWNCKNVCLLGFLTGFIEFSEK